MKERNLQLAGGSLVVVVRVDDRIINHYHFPEGAEVKTDAEGFWLLVGGSRFAAHSVIAVVKSSDLFHAAAMPQAGVEMPAPYSAPAQVDQAQTTQRPPEGIPVDRSQLVDRPSPDITLRIPNA